MVKTRDIHFTANIPVVAWNSGEAAVAPSVESCPEYPMALIIVYVSVILHYF